MTDNPNNVRATRLAARKQQIKDQRRKVETVRVEPTKDDYRKYLKHPNGTAFPASGPAEWPRDRFTNRRIADGSVKVASEQQQQSSRPQRRAAEAST